MVFKQNKEPFADESHQCFFGPVRKIDSMSHMASSDVIGSYVFPKASGGKVEIEEAPDENKSMVDCHNHQLVTADNIHRIHRDVFLLDDQPVGDPASLVNISMVANVSNDDFFRPELTKRPLNFDKSCEHTWKRPRLGHDHNDTLSHEVYCPAHNPEIPCVSDATLLYGAIEGDKVSGGDSIGNYPYGMSNMPWDFQNDNDMIVKEPSQRVLFHTDCSEKNHPSNRQVLSENTERFFWDYYPRKHVAMGPDHQADIPACRSQGTKDAPDNNMEKFMGSCVLPMPDAGPEASTDAKNRQGGLCCDCSEQGSMDCVRTHVNEARTKFWKTVGSHKFAELGFCDMGEDVALKWTEEEERLFQQVVLTHPPSVGQNFWKFLPQVFPSRSSKDLVSYYYNVFILRKRAAQNRCQTMYVDSDNDEWEEYDDLRFSVEEYEDDSAVESLNYHEGIYEHDDHEEEEEQPIHVQEEEDAFDVYGIANNRNGQGDVDVSEGCVDYKSSAIPAVESVANTSRGVEHDFEDDSCTYYEVQHCGGDSRRPDEMPMSTETGNNLHGGRKGALGHVPDPECKVA